MGLSIIGRYCQILKSFLIHLFCWLGIWETCQCWWWWWIYYCKFTMATTACSLLPCISSFSCNSKRKWMNVIATSWQWKWKQWQWCHAAVVLASKTADNSCSLLSMAGSLTNWAKEKWNQFSKSNSNHQQQWHQQQQQHGNSDNNYYTKNRWKGEFKKKHLITARARQWQAMRNHRKQQLAGAMARAAVEMATAQQVIVEIKYNRKLKR